MFINMPGGADVTNYMWQMDEQTVNWISKFWAFLLMFVHCLKNWHTMWELQSCRGVKLCFFSLDAASPIYLKEG